MLGICGLAVWQKAFTWRFCPSGDFWQCLKTFLVSNVLVGGELLLTCS